MALILAISSQVVHGHVGLNAIVPALQATGHEVWPVPTIVLSNHAGYERCAGTRLKATILEAMLEALAENHWLGRVDAVLSGYLPTADHAALVGDLVSRLRQDRAIRYLCDPIIGDDPKGVYIDSAAASEIRDTLVPMADIVTPNRFELAWLSGRSVTDASGAVEAARILGAAAVAATSIPGGAGRLDNVLAHGSGARTLSVNRLEDVPRGTGDLFSGLILGHVLAGRPLEAAFAAAVEGVATVLSASVGREDLELAALGPLNTLHPSERISVS